MPNSSPIDPQVEDIFSDTPIAAPEPLADQPVVSDNGIEVTESTPMVVHGGGRRRLLIIATSVLALLLLGGGGLALWLWLQARPEPTQPIIADLNTNATVVEDTNADAVVNVNEMPINTNSVNVNTQSFVDVDHDGLSDEEELIENTNPKKKDTDEDGLSDREEVRVYNTDPRNPDTDGDGYADGDEVTHFYDPNNPDPKKRLFDLPQ